VELTSPRCGRWERKLGLTADMYQRRAVPAQGSLRVIGEVTPERVAVVRKATKIIEEGTSDLSASGIRGLLSDKATG
jgi:GMP synthase (glutamine-hydrolysing)